MYNPRKINLYLENELPIKHDTQTGGTINYKLINNKKNKYQYRSKNKNVFIVFY